MAQREAFTASARSEAEAVSAKSELTRVRAELDIARAESKAAGESVAELRGRLSAAAERKVAE